MIRRDDTGPFVPLVSTGSGVTATAPPPATEPPPAHDARTMTQPFPVDLVPVRPAGPSVAMGEGPAAASGDDAVPTLTQLPPVPGPARPAGAPTTPAPAGASSGSGRNPGSAPRTSSAGVDLGSTTSSGTRKSPLRFGRYLLIERLARGGMGEVFLAEVGGMVGLSKLCAVKRIRTDLGADPEYVGRFIDEARIIVRMTHSNIVPVFDVGRVDQQYYLAMEYIAGKDARRILKRCSEQGGPVPLEIACFIVRELANGLAYAHRFTIEGKNAGLVHRDVSPHNVIVSYEGEVKLIDFGLATDRLTVDRSEAGVILGKFRYLAPEQIRALPVDRRTDIYTAGLVLFELCCGQPLHSGKTAEEVLARIGRAEPVAPSSILPDIPPELDRICLKATAREPSARYQSAEELRDDLSMLLATLAPRMNPDAVGALVRSLFAQDVIIEQERRDRCAQLAEEVLSPPADLTGTITIAQASFVGGAPSSSAASSSAPLAADAAPRTPSLPSVELSARLARSLAGSGPHERRASDSWEVTPDPASLSGRTERVRDRRTASAAAAAPGERETAAQPTAGRTLRLLGLLVGVAVVAAVAGFGGMLLARRTPGASTGAAGAGRRDSQVVLTSSEAESLARALAEAPGPAGPKAAHFRLLPLPGADGGAAAAAAAPAVADGPGPACAELLPRWRALRVTVARLQMAAPLAKSPALNEEAAAMSIDFEAAAALAQREPRSCAAIEALIQRVELRAQQLALRVRALHPAGEAAASSP
jgi:serine/threonine protein kinase